LEKDIRRDVICEFRESHFSELQQFAKEIFCKPYTYCVASEKNKNEDLAKYGEVKRLSWKKFLDIEKGARHKKQGTSLVPCFLYLVP